MVGLSSGRAMEFNFIMDVNKPIKFHVMELADGSFKTFEADHYGFIMHTGNTYVDGDSMIVDFEMYTDPSLPFGTMDMAYINDVNRKGIKMGAKFRRYTINMKSGVVTFNDILSYDEGNAGFPIINPKMQGKKHCYSYITELQNAANYNAVVKVDHCNKSKT